jgi:ABC-type multidrug transport system fused ATPase/permease subunit
MNKKQIILVLTAVILFGLSELFPPWYYKDGWTSAKRSAGYHFLFHRPAVKTPAEMNKIFSLPDNGPSHHFSVGRDSIRLYGQRMILLFLMVGLLLMLEERRRFLKTLFGVISLCLGFAFLAIYVWYISAI